MRSYFYGVTVRRLYLYIKIPMKIDNRNIHGKQILCHISKRAEPETAPRPKNLRRFSEIYFRSQTRVVIERGVNVNPPERDSAIFARLEFESVL